MSDNIAITAGTGTTTASDDCAGIHYAVVKLADGTPDGVTRIYAGEGAIANGLRVALALPATQWEAHHDIAVADGAHTDVELVAAPGASLCLYLTDVIISNEADAAQTYVLEEDEGGASAAQILGKLYVPTNSNLHLHFDPPRKLTANLSLGFTNTGQSDSSISVLGFTR